MCLLLSPNNYDRKCSIWIFMDYHGFSVVLYSSKNFCEHLKPYRINLNYEFPISPISSSSVRIYWGAFFNKVRISASL